MRYTLIIAILLMFVLPASSQKNTNTAKVTYHKGYKNYFFDVIVKDIRGFDAQNNKKSLRRSFDMDQSALDLPNDRSLYSSIWAQPSVSQGVTSACWGFSCASLYESEIYRITGKKVKLSEIYIVYCEYLEKVQGFIEKRGNSVFSPGSKGNAVARVMNKYGALPLSAYKGKLQGRRFHSHTAMIKEMEAYLNSLKTSNAWNEEAAIETIKAIMDHHIGTPPSEFKLDGKSYTPHTYLKNFLEITPGNFVDILSFKQYPYWTQVEFEVEDNWWHSSEYYNVPLDEFMVAFKKAVKNGFSLRIGCDFSESGFNNWTNCAMIPDYDIPSDYINEDARQLRLSNGATSDDHGFHVIGILENYKGSGKDWYLVKDSSGSSRNVGEASDSFGYYYMHEDYIKLKATGFTIHRDAVIDLLKKFTD